MKTQIKTLAIAAAAVLVGAAGWSALADTPAPGMPTGMSMHGSGGMSPGMMGGGFADPAPYLSSLKEKLGITEAQTSAWDVYAKTVQDTFASLKTAHDSADMVKFHKDYQQGFETLRAAAHRLAETLPDRQSQLAAEILPGLATGGHGMMGQAGMMSMMGGMGMMGEKGMGMGGSQ